MIDYGLAKRYICPRSGKHINFNTDKGLIGTTNFMSKSTHMGNEHSRRDDMEALGNLMIYFINGGTLPWMLKPPDEVLIDPKDPGAYENQIIRQRERMLYEENVLKVKVGCTVSNLCRECPI